MWVDNVAIFTNNIILIEPGARFTKHLTPKIFVSPIQFARFTKHLKPKIFVSPIQFVWDLRKS